MNDIRSRALASLVAGAPNTHNALQWLVTAMADAEKNTGKRSIFGKDKGGASFKKFLAALEKTLFAMHTDGVITDTTPPQQVLDELVAALKMFAAAYPNWPDAYRFADAHLAATPRAEVTAVILEVTESCYAFNNPAPTRG